MENQAVKPSFLSDWQKKKLLKWTIRQVLTIGLVYWFWDKPWMKYVLWVWIPLAILNLLFILFFFKILGWKLARLVEKQKEKEALGLLLNNRENREN